MEPDLSTIGRDSTRVMPPEGGSWDGLPANDHGCSVNGISVDELFRRYQECGFLYPAKLQRLGPHLPLIADNWQRAMAPSEHGPIQSVFVHDNPSSGAWASVSYWATTNRSVHSQHLVSVGRPEASRAVLLAAQCRAHNEGSSAGQNWFRAENRYPARVFGSSTLALGPGNSTVGQHACVGVPLARLDTPGPGVHVTRATDEHASALDQLARRLCGDVIARADEWTAGDVELRALDQRFRAVGLRRYRRVYMAWAQNIPEPVGFAVAYRGPLGLNFSFLENRCELWVCPTLDEDRYARTATSLVAAAAAAYDDFELPHLIVTTDDYGARVLAPQGATRLVDYKRSVWLRAGYPAWYDHVNSFYLRVLASHARRSLAGRGPHA